jgi:hypothetical protein
MGHAGLSIECGNLIDESTDFRSNGRGFSIALRVHAADDHMRDNHLCQTDYSLVVRRGDRAAIEVRLESIDDSWGRLATFGIDGFALQGGRAIATVVERGDHPVFQVISVEIETEKVEIFEIPRSFVAQIPPACRESFGVVGTIATGEPAVGYRGGGCGGSAEAWKLQQGLLRGGVQGPARLVRIDHSFVERLEGGEEPSPAGK